MKNVIEQFALSGDVGLRLRSPTIEELFANAAQGMYHLITDETAIPENTQRELSLDVDNYEDTLVRWLNELIFLFDTFGFVGRTMELTFQPEKLHARLSGGTFNPEIHEQHLLIKAATYHNLSVVHRATHWDATVVFDI